MSSMFMLMTKKTELIETEEKFIVFARHMVMLDAICDCLATMNVDFIRIDGSTKNDTRTTNVDRFQSVSGCRVAVLSITLTAAQLVLFAELDWNPGILAQAESRAHRIGQDGNVICRYLLAKGTADDVIWEMLKSKEKILNKVGIFNEQVANATKRSAPASSICNEKEAEHSFDKRGASLNKVAADFHRENPIEPNDEKANDTQGKENISNNHLSDFLHRDDEDFLQLNF